MTAARRFATEALSDLPLEVREMVELMVSELATNGVRHGQTSFELTVDRTQDELRIEVSDNGGGVPSMRSPTPDEPSGRGLRIVDLLAGDWGVNQRPGEGKTVWFTLQTPPAAAGTRGLAPACESRT